MQVNLNLGFLDFEIPIRISPSRLEAMLQARIVRENHFDANPLQCHKIAFTVQFSRLLKMLTFKIESVDGKEHRGAVQQIL